MSRRCIRLLAVAFAALAAGACQPRERARTRAAASPLVPAVPEVAKQARPGRPVIFIGLDGADWQMLDAAIAKGGLPNLKALVAEGTGGVLETLQPPLSPLVWTTMMTGVSPLQHGILDFTRFNPASGQKEPISSDERLEPALWNMATFGGLRVASFGMWATYPAEPVNGVLVSDRLFSFLYREDAPPPGVVFPASEETRARAALRKVESEIGVTELEQYLPWLDASEYARHLGGDDPYAHPVSALRRILVETRVYDELARDVFERERPDLTILYLQGTDSVGHVFAPYAAPRQASVSELEYEHYHAVPEKYFAEIDALVGRYKRLAQDVGAILMLASDHGFTWAEGRPTRLSSFALSTAAKWHRKEGVYLLWGPGVPAAPGHAARGKVGQVCATILSLLGLPPAGYLYAPALAGTPTGGASAANVDYRAFYKPSSLALAGNPAADKEALAKLKALGYIGAAEPGSAPKGAPGSRRTAGSYNNAGLILRDQGKPDEARAAFEQALALDPGLASAQWNLSELLFEKERDLARSDELLLKAFATGFPDGTRFLVGRAIGYQRMDKLDRSLKLLAAAKAARPDEPELWLFEGRFRVERGDCAGALADFQKAARLAPDNAAAFASLGLAHLCLGDHAGARRSFERSLTLDPAQPKLRDYLAKL